MCGGVTAAGIAGGSVPTESSQHRLQARSTNAPIGPSDDVQPTWSAASKQPSYSCTPSGRRLGHASLVRGGNGPGHPPEHVVHKECQMTTSVPTRSRVNGDVNVGTSRRHKQTAEQDYTTHVAQQCTM